MLVRYSKSPLSARTFGGDFSSELTLNTHNLYKQSGQSNVKSATFQTTLQKAIEEVASSLDASDPRLEYLRHSNSREQKLRDCLLLNPVLKLLLAARRVSWPCRQLTMASFSGFS